MMADGNLPPFLETSSALASFPEPPRSISISRMRVYTRGNTNTHGDGTSVVCVTRHGGGGKSLGATIVETKVDRAKSWTCCRGSEAVSSSRLTGNCPYLGRIKPARHVFVHFFTGCAPQHLWPSSNAGRNSVLFSRIFSTLVSNILRSVFSAWRRDFFLSFFFFNLSFPEFRSRFRNN